MEIPRPGPPPVQTGCAAMPMLVDLELIQRIEDAIATERSAFADGMAALRPGSGARWLPVAGGRAIFTGVDFFSNRALAMGLCGPVSHDDVERVETFYAECGVPSEIEIASMVDRSLLRGLNQRGYQLLRFHNIYAQALRPGDATGTAPAARSRAVEVHRSTPPPPWPGRRPCLMDSGTHVTPTATGLRPGTGWCARCPG